MGDIYQTPTGEKSNPIFNPAFGLAGFGFLFAWHFIILFNPLQYAGPAQESEFMLVRQVGINASLCIFFLIGGKVLSKLPTRDKVKSHIHLYIAMAIGVLGTLGLLLFSYINMSIVVVSVIMAGASEALMMLLWLRFYTETSVNYSGQTLGVSAVIASLITFFVYHLTFNMVVIVTAFLPIISGTTLIVTTRGIALRHNEFNGVNLTDWKSAKKPFIKATVQLMAMALFFGIVQGCYSPDDILLPMTQPFSILGSALAGIAIFIIYSRSEFLPSLNPIMNVAIIMFLTGVLFVPYRNELLSNISAFLTLTGFITYFLLVLILIIDLVRTFDLNLTLALGINQSLEYAMFTIGISVGHFIWGAWGDVPQTAFAITSVCSVFLMIFTLTFSTERPPWKASFYKPNAEISEETVSSDVAKAELEKMNRERNAGLAIIRRFNLTPREVDVFELLAKGRNAEYIQNSLVISNHTVKTHIYNIYRKMDIHSLQELLDIIDSEKDRIPGENEDRSDCTA